MQLISLPLIQNDDPKVGYVDGENDGEGHVANRKAKVFHIGHPGVMVILR